MNRLLTAAFELTTEQVQVLPDGAAERLGQRTHKTVLFLCTGNYYRSRFAEVFFNSVAGKMGLPWRASSRALALERGVGNVGPMSLAAVKALEEMGVRAADAVTRLPAQVTTDDPERAGRRRSSRGSARYRVEGSDRPTRWRFGNRSVRHLPRRFQIATGGTSLGNLQARLFILAVLILARQRLVSPTCFGRCDRSA